MRSNIAVLPQRRENRILKRGDIYYADLCGLEQSLGSEQTGRRPVLIIQNDVGNLHSPRFIKMLLLKCNKLRPRSGEVQSYNSYWSKRLVDDWMEEMIWVD